MYKQANYLTAVVTLAAITVGIGACAGKDPLQDEQVPNSGLTTASARQEPQEKSFHNPQIDNSKEGISAIVDFAKSTEPDQAYQDTALAEPNMESEPSGFVFHFATNQELLDTDDLKALGSHARYLVAHPETVVSIEGHADIRGAKAYNDALSLRRAEYVSRQLIAAGVNASQIVIVGHGEDVPVKSEHNWKENRRVEVQYIDDYMISSR